MVLLLLFFDRFVLARDVQSAVRLGVLIILRDNGRTILGLLGKMRGRRKRLFALARKVRLAKEKLGVHLRDLLGVEACALLRAAATTATPILCLLVRLLGPIISIHSIVSKQLVQIFGVVV